MPKAKSRNRANAGKISLKNAPNPPDRLTAIHVEDWIPAAEAREMHEAGITAERAILIALERGTAARKRWCTRVRVKYSDAMTLWRRVEPVWRFRRLPLADIEHHYDEVRRITGYPDWVPESFGRFRPVRTGIVSSALYIPWPEYPAPGKEDDKG